jgi:peptide-methionine (S)-S-oxide reductase
MEIATFGAGCFWGVEESFSKLRGVKETKVGYSGGKTKFPTYKQVCSKKTGHIEVVQLVFDPKIISYSKLLETFWNIHDPTSKDRQGPDIGSQYRSVIFYHTEKQKKLAESSKKKIKNCITQIRKLSKFYPAEDYHQKYFQKNKLRKFVSDIFK